MISNLSKVMFPELYRCVVSSWMQQPIAIPILERRNLAFRGRKLLAQVLRLGTCWGLDFLYCLFAEQECFLPWAGLSVNQEAGSSQGNGKWKVPGTGRENWSLIYEETWACALCLFSVSLSAMFPFNIIISDAGRFFPFLNFFFERER